MWQSRLGGKVSGVFVSLCFSSFLSLLFLYHCFTVYLLLRLLFMIFSTLCPSTCVFHFLTLLSPLPSFCLLFLWSVSSLEGGWMSAMEHVDQIWFGTQVTETNEATLAVFLKRRSHRSSRFFYYNAYCCKNEMCCEQVWNVCSELVSNETGTEASWSGSHTFCHVTVCFAPFRRHYSRSCGPCVLMVYQWGAKDLVQRATAVIRHDEAMHNIVYVYMRRISFY